MLIWIMLGLFLIGSFLIYRYGDWGGCSFEYCASVVILFLVFLFFSIPLMSIMEYSSPYTNKVSKLELASFADNFSTYTTGGGFLFMTINSEGAMEYNGYYRTTDGGLRSISLPAGITTIYESDRKPTIYQNWKHREWGLENLVIDRDFDLFYEVYVPKGSVVRNFKLDLE